MMNKVRLRALIELIHELVDDHEPWTEKKESLMALASEDEVTALFEFAAWFEEPDDGGGIKEEAA